jgi:recombination protein RecR
VPGGAIEDLVTELAKLPGIGRKTAQRLTFFLLKQPAETATRLAEAIRSVRERVRACGVCGTLTDEDPCAICRDPRRDPSLLCVVEEAADVTAIERAGRFRGRYHVLGGRLSPLEGIGPEALRLDRLVDRVANGAGVREVIIATNPSMEGEVTATFLQQLLRPTGVRVTRIARGLPVGGDLEYADGVTIAQALLARRDMMESDRPEGT